MATTTKTPVTVGEIKVGDLIEQQHDTRAYDLSSGRSWPVTDTHRYYVISISKWTTRLMDDGEGGKYIFRYRDVRLQSEINRLRLEAGKSSRPMYRSQAWSENSTRYYRIETSA